MKFAFKNVLLKCYYQYFPNSLFYTLSLVNCDVIVSIGYLFKYSLKKNSEQCCKFLQDISLQYDVNGFSREHAAKEVLETKDMIH